MKVLHVLDHSLPQVTEYSLKSRYIIKLQKDLGIKPLAVTSPNHETISNPMELIDGVFHYRAFLSQDDTNNSINCPFQRQKSFVSSLSTTLFAMGDSPCSRSISGPDSGVGRPGTTLPIIPGTPRRGNTSVKDQGDVHQQER